MLSKPDHASPLSADAWRQWETQGSRAQRLAYWNDVICQAVLDVNMEQPSLPEHQLFTGHIHSLDQVGARFVSFKSSSHGVVRTSKQVDRTDNSYLMVSVQQHGRSRLSQRQHHIVLNPGDIGIIDSGLPFELYFPETVDRRIVMMPKQLLASRMRCVLNWEKPLLVRSGFVLSPLIAQLILMLTEQQRILKDSHAHLLLESVADYLAESLSQKLPAVSTAEMNSREAFERVMLFIDQNMTSQDLSVCAVASAAGMSIRSVHRLFKRFGQTSCEQYIIQKRLALARQSLLSGAHRSVSEAAFAVGFNDHAHFTRRFNAYFGVNPSALLVKR